MYREMTSRLLEELRKVYPSGDVNISIHDLEQGSVVVKFRISGPKDQLSRSDVIEKLRESLEQNDSRLSSIYDVDMNSVRVNGNKKFFSFVCL
jgi:hypothetical protein